MNNLSEGMYISSIENYFFIYIKIKIFCDED